MAIIYFSNVDLPKLWSYNYLQVTAKGIPSWINISLRPCSEESHSNTNVLIKSSIANTIFVPMESFKLEKAYSATSFQTKALLLSSEVKGDPIFHDFLQTSYNVQ
jgi:hypothetical protein